MQRPYGFSGGLAWVIVVCATAPVLDARDPAGGGGGDPDGNVAAAPAVRYVLSPTAGRAGETVTVRLTVSTDEALRSLSIAVDFDESLLQLLDVRRAHSEGAPPQVADEVRATNINNGDERPGNQAIEGWMYVELSTASRADAVLGANTPGVEILELDFLIRPGAPAIRTPLLFRDVGPVRVLNQNVYLTNAVEFDSADFAEPIQLEPEALDDGEVEIIGEVGFFLRGDTNLSCKREMSDAVMTLRYLFQGSDEPPCLDAADADDSGVLELTDAVYTLRWLFTDGPDFPAPLHGLGEDATEDWLDCIDGFPDDHGCAPTPGPGDA